MLIFNIKVMIMLHNETLPLSDIAHALIRPSEFDHDGTFHGWVRLMSFDLGSLIKLLLSINTFTTKSSSVACYPEHCSESSFILSYRVLSKLYLDLQSKLVVFLKSFFLGDKFPREVLKVNKGILVELDTNG